MSSIEFYVTGRPAPQGSKRALGPGRMIEMSKYVKPWRAAVTAAATKAVVAQGWALLNEPCCLEIVFFMARPAHPKFDSPGVAPDLSKLVRATEDALTKVIWRDDSRVVYTQSAKEFVRPGEDPGALIRVYTIQADDEVA